MHQSKYVLSSDTPDIVLSSVFKKYDVDNSGELEIGEFQRALSNLGVIDETEQEILFRLADADNGGSIEVEEFIKLIKANEFDHILGNHDELEFIYQTFKTFQEFDDDDNGEITWEEFYFYLTKKGYTHQHISSYWNYLDEDQSKTVTFMEFWKGYKAMAEAQQKQIQQQQGKNDDMDEDDEKMKAQMAEKKKRSTLLDRGDSAEDLSFNNQDDDSNVLNKVKGKLRKSSHKMKESEFKVKVGKVVDDEKNVNQQNEENKDEDKKKKKNGKNK